MSKGSSSRGRGRGRGRGDQGIAFHPRSGGSVSFRGGFGGALRGDRGRGRGFPTEVEVFSQDDGQRPAPDNEVQRIENESAPEFKGKKSNETNPQRPGYGVSGREVILWTNYFNLSSKKDLELYRYSVAIAPDRGRVPVGKRAKRIVQLLIEVHFAPHGYKIATDFRSNLISLDELDLENDEFIVPYRLEEEDVPPPNATQHRCRVQLTGSLTLSELVNHLTPTQAGLIFGLKEEIIQALNIVLSHHPKDNLSIATIGANRHFSKSATA